VTNDNQFDNTETAVTGQLPQEGLELRNDVADKLGKLMERWEQRITFNGRKLGSRFLAGEIHVIVLFRINEASEKWFACIERYSADNSFFSDGNNKTMLIGVIESPEKPKRIIPTFVRLKPVDSLYSLPSRTLYASNLSGFVTIGGMKNRELNVFHFECSSLAPSNSDLNKMENQMVQRTPQIVRDISRNGGDLGCVDVVLPKIEAWLSSLGITICNERLNYRVPHPSEGGFQLCEVLVGPFNFYADQSQSIVRGPHCVTFDSRN
jgi:hypothetical protein